MESIEHKLVGEVQNELQQEVEENFKRAAKALIKSIAAKQGEIHKLLENIVQLKASLKALTVEQLRVELGE